MKWPQFILFLAAWILIEQGRCLAGGQGSLLGIRGTRIGSSDGPLANGYILAQLFVGAEPDQLEPFWDPIQFLPLKDRNSFLFGGILEVPHIPTNRIFFQLAVWSRLRSGEVFEEVPLEHLGFSSIDEVILAFPPAPPTPLRVSDPAIVPSPQPLYPPVETRHPTQPTFNTVHRLNEPVVQTFKAPFSGPLHSIELFTGEDGSWPNPESLSLTVHEVVEGQVQTLPLLRPWVAVDDEYGRPRFIFLPDQHHLERHRVYAMVFQGGIQLQASFTDVYPAGECFVLSSGGDVLNRGEKVHDFQFNLFPYQSEGRLELEFDREDLVYTAGENVELGIRLDPALTSRVMEVQFYDHDQLIGRVDSDHQKVEWQGALPGYHPVTATLVLDNETEIHSNVKTVLIRPHNDTLENAIALENIPDQVVRGTLLGASHQTGETSLQGENPLAGVWYQWTAPMDGLLKYQSSKRAGEIQIAFFEKTPAGIFRVPDFNPMYVNRGKVLEIMVGARPGGGGDFELNLEMGGLFGDIYQDRIPLTGLNNLIQASNEGATLEVKEPNHAGQYSNASLWWTWQPESSGLARIRLLQSEIPLAVGVYRQGRLAPSPFGLIEHASKTFSGGTDSDLTFQVEAGLHYDLAVAGSTDEQGPFTLSLSMPLEQGLHPVESARIKHSSKPLFSLAAEENYDIGSVQFELLDGEEATFTSPPFHWHPEEGLKTKNALRTTVYSTDGELLLDRSTDLHVLPEEIPFPPRTVSMPNSDHIYFFNHLGVLLARVEPITPWTRPRVKPIFPPGMAGHWVDVLFIAEDHDPGDATLNPTHYLIGSDGQVSISTQPGVVEVLPLEYQHVRGWKAIMGDENHLLALSRSGEVYLDFQQLLPRPEGVEAWKLLALDGDVAYTVSQSNRLYRWLPSQIKDLDPEEAREHIAHDPFPTEAGAIMELNKTTALAANHQLYLRAGSGWERLTLPHGVAGWVTASETAAVSIEGRLFTLHPEGEDRHGFVAREITVPRDPLSGDTEQPLTWIDVATAAHFMTGITSDGWGYGWGSNRSRSLNYSVLQDYPFPFRLKLFGNLNGEHSPLMMSPRNGTSIVSGESIDLSMDISTLPDSIVEVHYFAGAERITVTHNAPFHFSWSNPPAGSHLITAMAHDETGYLLQSNSAWLTVLEGAEVKPVIGPVVLNHEGHLVMQLIVPADRPYFIQGSDDLMQWSEMTGTQMGTGYMETWVDTSPLGQHRFYRLILFR